MAVKVALEHRTAYRFDRTVEIGAHTIRLKPAPHCRTPISGYSLRIDGAEHFINWQQDIYGNHAARVVFREPTDSLQFTVGLIADLTVINPFDFFVEAGAEHYPFTYPDELFVDLGPYLRIVEEPTAPDGAGRGPRLREWLTDIELTRAKGVPIVDFLVGINQHLAAGIKYSLRLEEGVQSPDRTLELGIGSCRDSAWLLVAALRALGLAARFVSGYLVQLAPDEESATARDFTDLHAWAEVFVPGAGWIGLDSTSGLLAGEGHLPLVGAPRPEQAAPITGTTGSAAATMEFSNRVQRIRADPQVARPYRPEQVEAIHALGHAVDKRLAAGDVRLTMGGEPTFVSASDLESAQWRFEADGTDKRRLGATLARRLARRWAPGGVLHHGQGKWYPGEPLPRWQTTVLWRADGVALWSDPDLLADPWEPGSPPEGAAARLTETIAAAFGIPADYLSPLFEDPLDRLAAEARQPLGEQPAGLPVVAQAQAEARAALVAALDAERGDPVAWAIPLGRAEDESGWVTTSWRTRRGAVFLRPGTSPAGFRLPLDALAWSPPPPPSPRSGYVPVPPLPVAAPEAGPAPARRVPADRAPSTALCVQERDGHIFVFLPPLPDATACAEVLAVIERAARAQAVPVVLEGYLPGGDRRLRSLSVTPDPGVIEVNVQPAADWTEFADIVAALHAEARAIGLATETFAMDGTPTPTGGGGHLTLGGVGPADSPLLRRPDLLVSMLTYWQHHPGLTYLFSGRFVGPTSQAPRVDEARHETLYELEIAFAELATLADEAAGARPWHVDRALRHLLVDVTGNTHRAEFCIDKLYSPDSDRGRLGLLELRGFEMAPHPSMSLVQALLVRALVIRFWEDPYRGPLIRWGTRLHDEFLLPEHALADVQDVIADLNAHDIAFDPAWLEPFAEFRFPRLGSATVAGIGLELRAAIEPWHVLGEEVAAGGTARYVDSSCERVQVRVTGAVPGRHVITCNGVPLPAGRCRAADTTVAGVRFRAWAPPSALHPTIGVHSPLVFDVVDTWNRRSLGAFTYHVTHPGGLAYERFPVNAAEAEARRAARFQPEGGTGRQRASGTWSHPLAPGPEYGYTLDMRRAVPGPQRN
ncbi:MAG TPA: transglutaminase family protein [Sporichthyaceae bacterium]|jgi:uncharacterized protein (DUF2126 family)|nr:transglutaminase family protein [Sporichthyaceae bacterium]